MSCDGNRRKFLAHLTRTDPALAALVLEHLFQAGRNVPIPTDTKQQIDGAFTDRAGAEAWLVAYLREQPA